MQLKFPYTKDRPMLMARLRKKKGPAKYFEFLIDSGADYTLISQWDAAILGVDYKKLKSKEIKVEVANLAFIHTKKVELIIDMKLPALTHGVPV